MDTGIEIGARVAAEVRRGLPFAARYEVLQRDLTSPDDPPEARQGRIHVDAEGRTRLDQETENLIIIADPVARLTTLISAAENRVMWRGSIGATDSETVSQGIQQQPSPNPGTEGLGTRTIDGLFCRGSRLVRAGSEVESWTAENLGMIVLQRERTDQHETSYRLFDLQRIAPEPSLFQVPDGRNPGGRH